MVVNILDIDVIIDIEGIIMLECLYGMIFLNLFYV